MLGCCTAQEDVSCPHRVVWAPREDLETVEGRENRFFDAPSTSSADCYIINKISISETGNGLKPHGRVSFSAGDCAVIVSTGQGGMAFRKLGMEVWRAANLCFRCMATAAFARPPSFLFSASVTRLWSPQRPVLSSTLLMPFVPGWDSQSGCLTCSQMHTHKPAQMRRCMRIPYSAAETAALEATCPRLNF